MSKNFKGSLFLISAALVWGLAFVAQKNAAGSIGVFSYIMCRSVVTCAVLIPLCLIRGRGLKRYAPMGPALRRGLVMGVLTFGAISLQQWGMEYTSASKSGFVTALYIVLVPLLGLFFGKKPGLKVWLAVAIALMGAALLSLDFSESLLPGPGEALTFGCALVFSLHILYVDHRAQQLDSTLMCTIQFGVCAVLGGVGAIFEGLTFSQISGNLTSILYVGAISGAVGTYSSIDPFVETYVCEKLGLTPDPLSTQVLARDRHAQVMAALAVTASTLESIAMQVRLLQQSDVIEAEEPFTKGQKGSSAMPHKRNPITAERVCGLARVVKANAQVAFDNVALWFERDISHSGAERVVLADSFTALDYMFGKMQWMLDGLQTYPAKMEHNLWRTKGLIFSSKVLLALVDAGISREDAYVIVQRNAMKVWEDIQNAVDGPTYRERLEADDEAMALLSQEKLDEIFDPWDFLTRKDVVFDRLQELEF